MRWDTHGGGSRGDRGPFDSPHGGACPTTPQTARCMTAAHAEPPWPIKTQLSGPDSIPTLCDWVWLWDCSERVRKCVHVCMCGLGVFLQSLVDEKTPPPHLLVCTVPIHSSVVRCAWDTHVHACFNISTWSKHVKIESVCVCSLWSALQIGCIGLRADRFVIWSHHSGKAPTPFYLVMTLGQSQYS